MVRRILLTANSIWAFVALPLLCTGGVLRHACGTESREIQCCIDLSDACCDEGDGSATTTRDCEEESSKGGCGHENCINDPCHRVVVVRSGGAWSAGLFSAVFEGGLIAIEAIDSDLTTGRRVGFGTLGTCLVQGPPAAATLPLLI